MKGWNHDKVLVDVMAPWVGGLQDWQVIAHLTFSWSASIWSAQRAVERFMRQMPGVSYFYALEENPGRDGFHVHMLLWSALTIYRREMWAKWFERFGRARIEPVRSHVDVTSYCAKYVCKEGAWWDVKILTPVGAVTESGLVLR
jgi:hypothetical protein